MGVRGSSSDSRELSTILTFQLLAKEDTKIENRKSIIFAQNAQYFALGGLEISSILHQIEPHVSTTHPSTGVVCQGPSHCGGA